MKHLAIIMDGNGRYALSRGLTREEGHIAGAEAFVSLIRDFSSFPLDVMSVYAFSTENANREQNEVDSLLEIIRSFLEKRVYPLASELRISIAFIGKIAALPDSLQKTIKKAPFFHEGKTMLIALNYGGTDEVARAAMKVAESGEPITQENVKKNLDTAGFPDPEALIRYGGYKRLSNFMPLQTTYTELFFLDKLWPEYEKKDVQDVMRSYEGIKRNFGVRHD